MSLIRSGVWSLAATLAAVGLMFWARAAFQVRTLPERIMEWVLIFVPLDAFEQGIRTFGPLAKVLALYGSTAAMSALLLGLGVLALRRRWSGAAILGIALTLFLVTMAGIMPLTGGGFFATNQFQHPVLVSGAYLSVALAYATVLLAGQVLARFPAGAASRAAAPSSRRALLVGGLGTAGGFMLAWRQQVIGGGTITSSLPVAKLPDLTPTLPSGESSGLPPASTPTQSVISSGATTLTPEPAVQTTPTPAAAATTQAPPETTPQTRVPADATTAPAADTPAAAPQTVDSPTATPSPPTIASPSPTTVPSQTATPVPPTIAPPTPTAVVSPTVGTPSPTPPPPTPSPDAEPFPTPGQARNLVRDKDGALTKSVRAEGELAALVTPTHAHYVVTKNAVDDPVLSAENWRLIIDGDMNRPVQLDYRTLRRLPAVEIFKTLECISNFTAMCHLAFFGCDLISTAQWKGARLRDVLQLAGGLKPGVVSLQMRGADEYSSSISPGLALDQNSLLVYEMNGQALPRQHGFPVRLLVPGRYGMKNAKWLVGIRAQREEHVDWYAQRGWNRLGFVRTMSRIDVPGDAVQVPAGRNRIAGIAYAGDRGVAGVEFSADGQVTWQPTVFLDPSLGRDTWVRWQAEYDIAAGQKLTLTSRAIDGTGVVQTEVFSLPQPNGGSGRHSIEVTGA